MICSGCGVTIKEEDVCAAIGFGDTDMYFCADCSESDERIDMTIMQIVTAIEQSESEVVH